MITKNQKGFTAVEIILAIVLVGAVGFAGYYAYSNNQKATSKTDLVISSPKPTLSPTSTIPAGYKEYVSTDKAYTFQYPDDWSLKANEEVLVTSKDRVRKTVEGIGALTSGVEVSVRVAPAEYASTEALKENYTGKDGVVAYQKDLTMTTLGGKSAVKSTCGHYVAGLCYGVILNKKHYTVIYSPSKADLYLDEFNILVTSFKFSAN